MARMAAATASLLQGNLLNTMASLGVYVMDRLTTKLVEDGYGDQLARCECILCVGSLPVP